MERDGWDDGLRILRVVQAINRKYKIGMSCSEALYVYMYKHFQLIIDMKSDVYNFIEKICNV